MSTVFSDPSRRPSRSSSPISPSLGRFQLPFRKNSSTSIETEKKEDSLSRWLRDGTVVYKSVGLGLMDLVVGMHLVKLANAKKVGTHIKGF